MRVKTVRCVLIGIHTLQAEPALAAKAPVDPTVGAGDAGDRLAELPFERGRPIQKRACLGPGHPHVPARDIGEFVENLYAHHAAADGGRLGPIRFRRLAERPLSFDPGCETSALALVATRMRRRAGLPGMVR